MRPNVALDGEDSRWGRGTMDVQGSRGGAVTLLPLLIYVVTCKVIARLLQNK